MDYIQLKSRINSHNQSLTSEMLTFALCELGFESFTETSDGLTAYIPRNAFDSDILNQITFFRDLKLGTIEFEWSIIEDQNWNITWEKNFKPILVANRCYVRAPFHEPFPGAEYEIIIEPKMSFGTGHHETTSLMIEQMLTLDFSKKNVLDMGSGTGILAILASKRGAEKVLAIDIEEWAYHNSIENTSLNRISNISNHQGDVQLIENETFDIILANINRNILLHDIPRYTLSLVCGGYLLISGIYSFDLDLITKCTDAQKLTHIHTAKRNDWISVLFQKE